MRILTVVGNRPQFVKSAPLSLALRAAGIEEVTLHTGQHYDRELSDVFFEELGLPEPRYRLGIGSAPRDEMIERMIPGIGAAIDEQRPDWVLVLGDTNSTLAGARAAAQRGARLAHVESGLRSGDWSMPEEKNRVETDQLAELLFCPDERSARQLAEEGVPGTAVVVGDVMADATRLFLPIAEHRQLVVKPYEPYAVLTIHREANTESDRLRQLMEYLNGTGATFVFPVHPRTRKAMATAEVEPAPSLHPIDPVGYLDMLALVAGSALVVTDSGGLQKEAYWLRVPCLTVRPTTEWVDTVETGANRLVDPADSADFDQARKAATFPTDAPVLYGDGHAADQIARALIAYAAPPGRR